LAHPRFDDWTRGTPDQAAALMGPYAGALDAWEVGAEVGNVKNIRPEKGKRLSLKTLSPSDIIQSFQATRRR
jgi:putative SOS response-associated peptidase YedK